jgi:8-oxo-dGTP pyrophosphatase MutT (NUDIX family)
VLILAYPRDGRPHIAFTQRTETVADHRGQISLPGGSRDSTDPDLAFTALRETFEELGVPPGDVEVVGRLDDELVVVSNFLVAPYVGLLAHEPTFVPCIDEVAHVIEVPLDHLRDPSIYSEEERPDHPRLRLMQLYRYNEYEIWGATARILHKFLASEYPDVLSARFGASSVEIRRG